MTLGLRAAVGVAVIGVGFLGYRLFAGRTPHFGDLRRTVVVASLKEPLPENRNVVWSAAFELGWQKLIKGTSTDRVPGQDKLCQWLNQGPDLKGEVPADGFKIEGGQKGDLFVRTTIDSNIEYERSYAIIREPSNFRGSTDRSVKVGGFGIPPESEMGMHEERKQIQVLFDDHQGNEGEWAMNLNSHGDKDVIVALIKKPKTLEEAIEAVQAKTNAFRREYSKDLKCVEEFGECDTLQVPNIEFTIQHSFDELTSKKARTLIREASEKIQFSLNKEGARLRASAKITVEAKPRDFVVDRPFLVMLRLRGHKLPYFAMWVDNADLLGR